MLYKRHVVFDERFKVIAVFGDVSNHILSVPQVGVVIAIQLVSQRSEQTVTVADHLSNLQSHLGELRCKTLVLVRRLFPLLPTSCSLIFLASHRVQTL